MKKTGFLFSFREALLLQNVILTALFYGLMKIQFQLQPSVQKKNIQPQVMQTVQSAFLIIRQEQKNQVLFPEEVITRLYLVWISLLTAYTVHLFQAMISRDLFLPEMMEINQKLFFTNILIQT